MKKVKAKFKLGPNQRKWVRALKSGRYKKTTGKLESDGRYCCLGVGCRIFRIPIEQDDSVAPDDLIDKLALNGECGDFSCEELEGRTLSMDGKCSLAEVNDEIESKRFEKVIEVIEKYPEIIFKKSK